MLHKTLSLVLVGTVLYRMNWRILDIHINSSVLIWGLKEMVGGMIGDSQADMVKNVKLLYKYWFCSCFDHGSSP